MLWIFYILVSLDVYSLVLHKYKGLQTVGRWVFIIAITLAVGISAASLIPTGRSAAESAPLVFYFALVGRGIMFSLVLFILLILFFLSRYPIALSRNVVVHVIVCTVFLISHSMGYLVRNVRGNTVTHTVNVVHLVITIACYATWMIMLTRRGEETKMVVRREFTPAEEKRLVDQLTSINSSLLRATRKKMDRDADGDDDRDKKTGKYSIAIFSISG